MGVYLPIKDYSVMQGPAPSGFHVPSNDEWVALIDILKTTFGLANSATTMGTYLKMPMAGRRSKSDATISNVGSYGYYWSSVPYDVYYADYVRFTSSSIIQNYESRAYGYSVRCFKNSPTVPTSSWTTLYDGSSIAIGAGVFYNATDELISVSGNGVTWYTIQDKNLGATVVFNQGDTETDTNCGYFYQWGNNYGFAHSGSITTSSTKVDASTYGPGNYYNSSTFVTSNGDRSSVQNDNLWGGVTRVVQKELKNAYIGIPDPTSIVLNKSSISLTTVGQTAQLTATIEPTVSDKTITWGSDDTTVATVSTTGLVTCVTPGTCTITATTVNGLTASCSVAQSRLPSAYQEVEWIESSGTQWINLGLKASNTISLSLTMRPNMSYTSEYAVLGDAWSADALFFMEYQGKYRLHNGGNYGDFANVTDVKTTIEIDSSGITINNTAYTLTAGSNYSNNNIRLFATGDGTYTRNRGRYKVYSLQISDNNVLVRDLVPCYRIADSVIGLYDLVNDVFYTNSGSGTFTKGADVD